ncbi:MAG: DPP IV N-terminal domain-containing protein, partial [Bacteroidia bacterium]|nr:DPP IV N-terminal domain-containing protein [Bacteroidia bacterium]
MKKFLLFSILSFFILQTNAQNKLLTMEEAVLGGRGKLFPARLSGLQFIPGTADYSYVDNTSGTDLLVRATSEKGLTKVLISEKELTDLLKKADENGRFWLPSLKWINSNTFTLQAGLNTYEVDPVAKTVKATGKEFMSGLSNADHCEKNHLVAFTKKNNLFIYDKGTETQVTDEKNTGIVFAASNVHRNEFGISKGTFWSNSGNFLAFYRMDQTMVNDYSIVDWKTTPAENKPIKYPMAGGTSHQVTIGIYDVTKKTILYLKTGNPDDHYFTNIAWSPDDKNIYIAELNRDQNHMKFNQYSAVTGNFIKTLFEEKDEKYTEPLKPMLFVKNNAAQFLWESNKDGFNHIYLYDTTGKIIRQLTSGNWEVLSVNGFDEKGERLFFHANTTSPVNKDFYSVSIKKGLVERITAGDGIHECKVDEKGIFVLDEFTNLTTPCITSCINSKTKKSSEIFKAPNPLKDYELGKASLFSIKGGEGTPLWCRMYTPAKFDSTKKYPVVVYLYGGPHHQEVTNTWQGSWNLWFQYMAERGYIVFSLDNRGSGNRGKAFEQATFRNLGTVEMEDQLKGVEFLKSLSYVDQSRIGVHGWSFGGFMTSSLMTRHPGIFKNILRIFDSSLLR